MALRRITARASRALRPTFSATSLRIHTSPRCLSSVARVSAQWARGGAGLAPATTGGVGGTTAQQFRTMFIQTESTPNPDGLKFVPGETVLPEEAGLSMDFAAAVNAAPSPLARRLFRVDGVARVFLAREYLSITKDADFSWQHLKPHIFATIMDFYAEGHPVVLVDGEGAEGSGPRDSLEITDDDSEVVMLVKELLETRIRPFVNEDGGDIVFRGFDEANGLVRLQLIGACASCPSSTVTLRHGVENMLKHYIPEVAGVEAVDAEDVGGDGLLGDAAWEDGPPPIAMARPGAGSAPRQPAAHEILGKGAPGAPKE